MKNGLEKRWIIVGIILFLCIILCATPFVYYAYHSHIRKSQQPIACKYDGDCEALDCNGVGLPPACGFDGDPICNQNNNRCECTKTCL